jgi:hypothetical protein
VTVNLAGLLDALTSHVKTTVKAESVTQYEPEAAPAGKGLSVAVWVGSIRPVRGGSGLDSTTLRAEFVVRLYFPLGVRSQETADRALIGAVDDLGAVISGDFTLGNTVMNVDLLGQYGDGVGGTAGYSVVDGAEYRVFTLLVPLILSDMWPQSP